MYSGTRKKDQSSTLPDAVDSRQWLDQFCVLLPQIFEPNSCIKKFWIHSSVVWLRYLHTGLLIPLKHREFFAFPLTNITGLTPVMLAEVVHISLILMWLPPLHFSLYKSDVFCDKRLIKHAKFTSVQNIIVKKSRWQIRFFLSACYVLDDIFSFPFVKTKSHEKKVLKNF